MATNRIAIRNTIAELLKTQLDGVNYTSNVYTNVETRHQFWDSITDWPTIAVVLGSERTEYHPSGFSWKKVEVFIKVYTDIDDQGAQLEQLLIDIEDIMDANNSLEYLPGETTEQISILSVEDDGGILYPFAVGEISLMVQYQSNRLF